jgi:predicted lipoprotein with Yx(FWY)xxD motif
MKIAALLTLLAVPALSASFNDFVGLEAEEVPLTQSVLVDGRPILANSLAQTLYVFDPDQSAGKPTCNATCAEKWPPYILTNQEAATLQAPFAVTPRDNKLSQLTFHGRPVYLFYLDRAMGEVKGNGLGGVWHLISLE